ncbi:hypothetical protein GCM10010431_09110 [Streptomyces kunmingensis]
MHARGLDRDTDLAGAGFGVLGLLVGEVLGGAEGVESDGVHGGSPGAAWWCDCAAVRLYSLRLCGVAAGWL